MACEARLMNIALRQAIYSCHCIFFTYASLTQFSYSLSSLIYFILPPKKKLSIALFYPSPHNLLPFSHFEFFFFTHHSKPFNLLLIPSTIFFFFFASYYIPTSPTPYFSHFQWAFVIHTTRMMGCPVLAE